MIACIIAGAGSGKRFLKGDNLSLPKQFHKIGKKPILEKVIENFSDFPTVVSIRKEDEKYFKENYKNALYAIGGETRQESIRKGLIFIKQNFPEIKYILIADAVRPFTSKVLIQSIVNSVIDGKRAVIPVIQIVDTLKEVKNGCIIKTLPRENIVCAQTPQGFEFEMIYNLHEKFADCAFTDDSALCEAANIKVHVIEGERANIKVTFSEDIS